MTRTGTLNPIGVDYLAEGPGSGYGEAAVDYMAALRAAGVPLRWTPLEWGSRTWGPAHNVAPVLDRRVEGGRHRDICNLEIAHDTTIAHCPPLWYEGWSRTRSKQRYIANTTWETDLLPPAKVAALARFDAVLVPSHHNRETFLRSGVTAPISIVPHVARPARPVAPGRFHAACGDAFVFYVIGPWTTRKALAETIQAYTQAFSATDPVLLIVKTGVLDQIAVGQIHRGREQAHRYDGMTWWTLAQLLAGRRDAPRIQLVAEELPRAEIDELHARGDCFVSLSRAEGWSLGAAEAAVHGNPVVVTGWGGQRDFLGSEHPYYVDYRLTHAIEDALDDWYTPEPAERWARADVTHASALLREVYEHRDVARAHAAELQRTILADFSEAKVGAQLLAALA